MKTIFLMIAISLCGTSANGQTKPSENPSLKDTLQWMQNSLNSGSGDLFVGQEKRAQRLTEFSGCQVRFVYTTSNLEDGKEKYRQEQVFNLGDIDSGAIQLMRFPKNNPAHNEGVITAPMRNDEEKGKLRVAGNEYPNNGIIFAFEVDYAVRFTKAFRHAVSLCGGKPSIF